MKKIEIDEMLGLKRIEIDPCPTVMIKGIVIMMKTIILYLILFAIAK